MIYNVSHKTTFTYSQSVSISQHLLHLAPRTSPQQSCRRHALVVEPAPTLIKDDVDYFGNPMSYLTIEESHDELTIVSSSTVEVTPPTVPPASETPPWDQVASAISRATRRDELDAFQFAFSSPFTGSSLAGAFTLSVFEPGRPILEAALDLMDRIYREFKYEGGVTDVYTPVDQVLTDRRGVCQDFAHLQIACLRSLGLPARYVSGYLLTHPPEGQEKLVGADASHAWLAIWIPGYGWIDLDPTNNVIPGDEHITVAWGRDYGDVSPINGLVIGGGEHKIDVAVDVRSVAA